MNNTSLISLLQLLGPNGVMRVGGDGEESMPPNLLTQEAANDTAGFLNQLGPGWSLLYGLPDDGNTSDAVQQAGYLLNALGSGRVAFQVSNEPDLHYRGNEQAWLNIFNSEYSALTAAYGPLNYGAPDTSQLQDLSRPQDTPLGESGFQRLTTHKYWPYACNPLPYFPSANSILDDARSRIPAGMEPKRVWHYLRRRLPGDYRSADCSDLLLAACTVCCIWRMGEHYAPQRYHSRIVGRWFTAAPGIL